MKQLFIFLIIVSSISCQDIDDKTAPVSVEKSYDNIQDNVPLSLMACYATTAKDSVLLKISISDNSVKGTLIYNLYQKDKNTGTIDGKLYGDTLIAYYQFRSEGIESIREVAFLIKDQVITEGYGEVEERDGEMIFKDWKSLDFKNGLILKKIDCE